MAAASPRSPPPSSRRGRRPPSAPRRGGAAAAPGGMMLRPPPRPPLPPCPGHGAPAPLHPPPLSLPLLPPPGQPRSCNRLSEMFELGVWFLRFYFCFFIYLFSLALTAAQKPVPRGCSLRSALRAGAPQSKAQQTLAARGGQGFASPRQGQLRGCRAPRGAPGPEGLLGKRSREKRRGAGAAGGIAGPPSSAPDPGSRGARGQREPRPPPGHFGAELDAFSAPSPGARSDVSAPQGAGEGRRRGRAGETWHRGIFPSHFSELMSSK
nr:collagen alpha-1(I) chain-like [Anas platyrhynchos]